MTISEIPLSRRGVLASASAATVAATVATTADSAAKPRRPKVDYPFTLGVASGDPEPDSVVLWTRLAPRPFDVDHGMRGRNGVMVRWRIATDERMRRVVSRGKSWTGEVWAHSVHVEARGLRPGREYWYQFEAGGHVSPVGRTRTAPAPGSAVASLTFASISCQAYDHGYFTSFPHIVADDPDFVMHLGDYIYEYAITPTGGLRNQPVPEVVQARPQTLRQWRARHALAKSDPDQQALHRQIPMVLTWDDHEYLNDYAGTAPDAAGGGRSRMRTAAYRAYWEHQPLRSVARFKQGEIRLYRRLAFGDLLQVDMIDGRQFRSVPPCGWGEAQACEAAYDPAITMLGAPQEQWLYAGLGTAGATWNSIGNNVMMSRLDHDGDLGELLWNDAWDGFPAARTRLLDQMVQRQVSNPMFITGDWHSTFVNDILADFDAPDSPVMGTEFVTTSITTNGDTPVYGPYYGPMIQYNPHIKFFDGDRRGYQRHTLTHDTWTTDLVMVDKVGTPTSPASVQASFVVENGLPGAIQVGGS